MGARAAVSGSGQMKIDVERLSATLADRLGRSGLKFAPIDVACAWQVFKVTSPDGAPLFVKLADPARARQTRMFLTSVSAAPFLPQVVLDEPLAFDGYDLLVLDWMESTCVNAEDMSDAQFAAFADGCRSLSSVLAAYRGELRPVGEDDPDLQWSRLSAYAVRHPLAGRLLRPLLEIPVERRSYGSRALVTIHGDFQPRNYGFRGERFAAVFDFDALTTGLACEDAVYAFTERARRAELAAAKRRRLTELFLRLVGMSPWPKDEWFVAVNHARLRIAARRLDKHPDLPFVALDIAQRDRPLRRLAVALEGESC